MSDIAVPDKTDAAPDKTLADQVPLPAPGYVGRFFDSDLSFLSRGLGFIAVGVGFLVANVILFKRRTKT